MDRDQKKKIIVIVLIILLIILIILFKPKSKNKTETTIENNIATSEVEVEDVTFSDIKKVYENGITTLSATMINNTKVTKNFTIKIILKDDNGKELESLEQIVENLEPGRKKVLTTGILGDYSKIKDIKFEVVK